MQTILLSFQTNFDLNSRIVPNLFRNVLFDESVHQQFAERIFDHILTFLQNAGEESSDQIGSCGEVLNFRQRWIALPMVRLRSPVSVITSRTH